MTWGMEPNSSLPHGPWAKYLQQPCDFMVATHHRHVVVIYSTFIVVECLWATLRGYIALHVSSNMDPPIARIKGHHDFDKTVSHVHCAVDDLV